MYFMLHSVCSVRLSSNLICIVFHGTAWMLIMKWSASKNTGSILKKNMVITIIYCS